MAKSASMNAIICGSRTWTDKRLIWQILERHLPYAAVVFHGDADGADRIAAQVAKELGFEVQARPADWSRHGKAAGPIRNQDMLREATPDMLIAFLDLGQSKGTRDMIHAALAAGVPKVLIVRPGQPTGIVSPGKAAS